MSQGGSTSTTRADKVLARSPLKKGPEMQHFLDDPRILRTSHVPNEGQPPFDLCRSQKSALGLHLRKNVTQSSCCFRLVGFIHDEARDSIEKLCQSFCLVATASMPRKATEDMTLLKSVARTAKPTFQQRKIARFPHNVFHACCIRCTVATAAGSYQFAT